MWVRGASRRTQLPLALKGRMIYRNPDAESVGRVVRAQGQRANFTLANVEWISMHGHVIGVGGFGRVFLGKAKFKGRPNPLTVAIKRYGEPGYLANSPETFRPRLKEVVKRLTASKATHPRMAYLEVEGVPHLVEEAFTELSKDGFFLPVTKFNRGRQGGTHARTYVEDLDLSQARDESVFEQMATQAAELGKARIGLGISTMTSGRKTIDIFSSLEVGARGRKRPKIFVQDVDALRLATTDRDAWECSKAALLEIVMKNRPVNQWRAAEILATVGHQHGFT